MVFFRLPALAHTRLLILFICACGPILARADISGQSSPGRPANLVTVQLAREADVSIVTLEADGPLPEPTFGVAHDPFRFYVDFPNVAPESRGVLNSTDPFVLRVRVSAYSTEPLISRVVLDLKRELPIRVDTDGRGAGRIRILVGMNRSTTAAKTTTPGQASVPPVPSLPPNPVTTPPANLQAPPPTKPSAQSPAPTQPQSPNPAPQPPPTNKPSPPASSTPQQPKPPTSPVTPPPVQTPPPQPPPVQTPPSQPPVQTTPSSSPPPPSKPAEPTAPVQGGPSGAPPPPPGFNPLATPPAAPAKPTKGDERYRSQIIAPLDQLRALRPMLASIDLLKPEAPTGLPAAIERVESIRQTLAGVKPPPEQGPTHDMLLQSCTLAQRALKLRISASDAATLRNAGSAAAGALLLLDRVCIDLGCGASTVRR
jgi:hypothetical protein